MSTRFFIDHGAIHDVVTGKHVAMVNFDEDWQSSLVILLNELDHKGRECDKEVKRLSNFIRRIAADDKEVIEYGSAVVEAYDTGTLSHEHIEKLHDALALWAARTSTLKSAP